MACYVARGRTCPASHEAEHYLQMGISQSHSARRAPENPTSEPCGGARALSIARHASHLEFHELMSSSRTANCSGCLGNIVTLSAAHVITLLLNTKGADKELEIEAVVSSNCVQ